MQKIIILFLLIYSSSSAKEYCNSLAKAELWKKGISNQVVIKNITNEFPKNFNKLINFLDNLAIENSEQELLNYIKVKTQVPIIRIRKDSPRFQWEIKKENSSVSILIDYYKNCISRIMLMDMQSNKVYSRYTKLSHDK